MRSYQWQDPAISAAAARELDGMAFLSQIVAGTIPPPPIALTLGFELVLVEPGRAVFGLTPADYHYNPIGSVHGGVYATLCDSACGCAVHRMRFRDCFVGRIQPSARWARRRITSASR